MTKIAIIPSGTQGIGRGIANRCRGDGWRGGVLDRDVKPSSSCKNHIVTRRFWRSPKT